MFVQLLAKHKLSRYVIVIAVFILTVAIEMTSQCMLTRPGHPFVGMCSEYHTGVPQGAVTSP